MEFRLLRAFLTVTELRHFGRAAEALNVTQPALSKQVAALEDSLGARLFERGRHGAELTSFGAGFLADAQTLVRDADELLARAREASSGKRGYLRVGLGLTTLTLAPQLIAEFRRLNPNVSVTLNDLSSAEQTRRLLAGKLDVGFIRLPADTGLSCLPLLTEALALAVPQHARWKRLPSNLNELNEPGLIALARSSGPGLAAQIDHWCSEHGFVPRVIQQTDDIQSVLAAVAAGVGAAFLPSRAKYLLRDARVLPLRDAAARWQVGLGWEATRENAVAARFVEFVRAAKIPAS
ncbi:LysR family transcriptional regulator [Caballeronia udeis]|uniref:LysR family transcriptional regulator n=1 Tax=Caballeronia udeis TaxID=1232866 RepID=A0A158FCT6_9BURK|nr:LysR family transcriptional regulator [Caballeronia udeis]SAL17119.1 LysR family transcriptional regulator [Caballeronia udeis]